MNLIRRTARTVSGKVGRSNPLINALRPAYDRLLDWSSRGRGILHTVNDNEQFYIDPNFRVHVPDTYDPEVCDYLREHVGNGDVCLNVGAHVGIYALCLAQWSAPDGRVFAFEPNPATRAALEKHVVLNESGERIEVVAKAVSDAPGEASFFATELEGFSRLGQPNPKVDHEKLSRVTVEVTSIDAFCEERKLRPDWITMDIEGYEIAAIAGAVNTIKAGRGRLGIVMEMHPNLWEMVGTSREELESLMAELSIRPISLTGQQDALGDYGIVRFEYV